MVLIKCCQFITNNARTKAMSGQPTTTRSGATKMSKTASHAALLVVLKVTPHKLARIVKKRRNRSGLGSKPAAAILDQTPGVEASPIDLTADDDEAIKVEGGTARLPTALKAADTPKTPFWPPINWDTPVTTQQHSQFSIGGLPSSDNALTIPRRCLSVTPRAMPESIASPRALFYNSNYLQRDPGLDIVQGGKTLNVRLDTPRAGKGHVYVCVDSKIGVEDLFRDVQRRLSRRLGNEKVTGLILRRESEPDSDAFEVESDDSDTWTMCIKRFAQQAGDEVDLLGEVVFE
jgi:hypothetical protein